MNDSFVKVMYCVAESINTVHETGAIVARLEPDVERVINFADSLSDYYPDGQLGRNGPGSRWGFRRRVENGEWWQFRGGQEMKSYLNVSKILISKSCSCLGVGVDLPMRNWIVQRMMLMIGWWRLA